MCSLNQMKVKLFCTYMLNENFIWLPTFKTFKNLLLILKNVETYVFDYFLIIFLWQSMSYKVNLFVRDIYGLLFETKELKFYWLSFTTTYLRPTSNQTGTSHLFLSLYHCTIPLSTKLN